MVGLRLITYIAIPNSKNKNLRALWRECGKVIDKDLSEAEYGKIKLVRELIIKRIEKEDVSHIDMGGIKGFNIGDVGFGLCRRKSIKSPYTITVFK